MSIKAMTWAFGLPLEPRAKIALLAIADNARDDGVAWPSRDTIADKSSQSRATVKRRLKILTDLGVLGLHERYREDGTQTTDEIRLNLSLTPEEVMRRVQALKDAGGGDEADDQDERDGDEASLRADRDADDAAASRRGGGVQPAPPGVHSGTPGGAVVTRGGVHSGTPQDEPSLEPDSPPNPPPGGASFEDGPLKKADKAAIEKRSALWDRFASGYPGIATMDQQAARAEFEQLAIDDAEWAVSVLPALKEELRKAGNRPPKNAHIWLRKAMFANFPRARIEAPPPEQVWIAEGSEEDRALRFVRNLVRQPTPFVRALPHGSRAYRHKTAVGADLLAMLLFEGGSPLGWPKVDRGTRYFAAWQARLVEWTGQPMPTEPGTDQIRVPTLWPPKKDGTIYADDQSPDSNSEGSA